MVLPLLLPRLTPMLRRRIRLRSEEDRDEEEDDDVGSYAPGAVAVSTVGFPPIIRRPSTILTTSTRYTSPPMIYRIKDYDDDEEEERYKHRTNKNEYKYKYRQKRV